MELEESFPRALTPQERELLMWILPEDRPGYREYRSPVSAWKVVAMGRRGTGNYILAPVDRPVDSESPLPQIFASGVVRTSEGEISVSIRERLGDQIEFEIVNLRGDAVPSVIHEANRWTFSTWSPKQPCPICLGTVREVELKTVGGQALCLVFCPADRRIWLHDGTSGVNHPVPLTNFYNELMLQSNIRDPQTALDVKRLFTDLRNYPDADLARAFVSYNQIRTKVVVDGPVLIPERTKRSWWRVLRSRLLKS